MRNKKILVTCLLLLSIVLTTDTGWTKEPTQEAYPTKDINWVIQTAPGGGWDTYARAFAPVMGQILGKQLVIRNNPGAGGVAGNSFVAHSRPDGYTIGTISMPGMALNSMIQKLDFDIQQLSYIGRMTIGTSGVFVKGDSKINSIDDLKKAGQLTLASGTGVGSTDSYQTLLLVHLAGLKVKIVGYNGTNEAALAVMRGEADFAYTNLGIPYTDMAKLGQIKFIAAYPASRVSWLPNVKTVKEQGYPEFTDSLCLQRVVFAPPGTPPDRVKKLEDALVSAGKDPRIVSWGEKSNMELGPEGAEQTRKDIMDSFALYQKYLAPLDAIAKAGGTH